MDKKIYKKMRSQLNFKLNPKYFWLQLAVDFLFLCGITFLFLSDWSFLNTLLIPLFMFRQFSILHEAVHGLIHPNQKVNFIYGAISGTFCLTPFAIWKSAHLKHHYWTGNLEKDPTFSILKNFRQSSKFKRDLIQFCWKKGIPFLAFLQHFGFLAYFFKNVWAQRKTSEYMINFSITFVFGAFILFKLNLNNLVITSIGTVLYFKFFEDMVIPQHVGLYSDDSPESHAHPWEQIEISRTWKLNSILENLITFNMNYHTEHHVFQDLPWYELKQAHRLIQAEKECENLNFINTDWMKQQRLKLFSEAIQPIPQKIQKVSA